jgi:formate C-acetyltransferase
VTGYQLGAHTGDPRNFKDFDELLEAFWKQRAHLLDLALDLHTATSFNFVGTGWYNPFLSSFIQDSLDKGVDFTRGASRYPELSDFPFIIERAMQDASDSLVAIKKMVFEEKKLTMDQVLSACAANFEGAENERIKKMLADCPKYGNDDDEADAMMSHIWHKSLDMLKERPIKPFPWAGESYVRSLRQGASWCWWAGEKTGALPNGVHRLGEVLSDAALSPVHGCDHKGPTAVINSANKMDVMYIEGTLLNQKFTPTVVGSPEGQEKFKAMLKTYFQRGGFHIQFNILGADTLREAKEHPEEHRNLVVRVGGYSAYWVDLPTGVQDDIIARTEQTSL